MFDDKKKTIIIVSLAIALVMIIALAIWWLLASKKNPQIQNQPTDEQISGLVSYEPPVALPATPERLAEDKSYPLGLRQLAMSFAERYGSYSSDEPSKNLDDLQPFVTQSLAGKLKNEDLSSDIFVGFSTKALSLQLLSANNSNATVLVKTQRTQNIGDNGDTKVFYADLELRAVNINNEWKIDEVAWK